MSCQPGHTGQNAASFGSDQQRVSCAVPPGSNADNLYDRVAGALLREVGERFVVSALAMYPIDLGTSTTAFAFHLLPRPDAFVGRDDLRAQNERLCRVVTDAVEGRPAPYKG